MTLLICESIYRICDHSTFAAHMNDCAIIDNGIVHLLLVFHVGLLFTYDLCFK